jgi:N-acyl-D-amino-acid deacylase
MEALLIKNGIIVDGSGKNSFPGHVLVEKDKIAAIFRENEDFPMADKEIDAAGCIVSPGFIDMHSHSDWLIPHTWSKNLLKQSLEQGITTIVGGNCGFSPAPVTNESKRFMDDFLSRLLAEEPFDYKWHSMGEYLDCMEKNPPVLNLAELVGHVALRYCAAGNSRKKMSGNELEKSLEITEASLHEGACGLSFGLGYEPGMFCDTDELEAFCRVAAKMGKPVTVHMKALSKISPVYPPTYLKPHNIRALTEMITIAEKTGVKLQLSHFIFVGRHSWHLAEQGLELVDRAIDNGVDVMVDAFPYTCGNTTINVVFPYWFLDSLPEGHASFWKKLRLKIELEVGFRLVGFIYKDFRIMDAVADKFEDLNGLTVLEVSKKWRTTPFQAMLRLSRETSGDALMLFSTYSGDDENQDVLEKVLSCDYCLFETDAILRSRGYPNPASLGTFPKILGEYVRDKHLFSIENAIMRMTSKSAKRFAINDRGRIEPGLVADIVVFDPEKISDKINQHTGFPEKPDGIKYVFVNGQKMVHEGEFIDDDKAAGRILRI